MTDMETFYEMDHGQADVHVTTNDDPKDDDVAGFGSSFSSKAIRHAFIRKVYLILTLQLSFTLGMVALFTLHHDVKLFVQRHQYIYWASYGVFLVTYITLMCCGSVRRKHPWNFILLTLFGAEADVSPSGCGPQSGRNVYLFRSVERAPAGQRYSQK
ncbi:Protein lifeguard 1 [Amphibalanus amphitrite]|uniref:Protein lifeguard 1 n=1 Tax=Amphibalanus amphitrite TaxID=1232801 RepID=A0A6A4WXY0_AMPAM|nr:Protein lifeguard 1 [Amphibalanus amphitrite]